MRTGTIGMTTIGMTTIGMTTMTIGDGGVRTVATKTIAAIKTVGGVPVPTGGLRVAQSVEGRPFAAPVAGTQSLGIGGASKRGLRSLAARGPAGRTDPTDASLFVTPRLGLPVRG